jgi:hypothetical protein
MQLDGNLKRQLLLILSLIDDIMELPINFKEFEYILEQIKNKNPQLYNKLWAYKFNHLINKQK